MGEGGGRESGVRFTGLIELGVIHEALEEMLSEDIAKWEEVDNEEEGPQDRALWNT